MKEARFYERLEDEAVRCALCCHRCVIKEGKAGICGVRRNEGGTLYSLVYGRLVAANVDPIEKKPLFHFQPGSRSYSIATAGCNFRCLFCQNADISQLPREHGAVLGSKASPDRVVEEALKAGCASISYTYTEPTVFMEYALEVASRARAAGLTNVFVTNGFMSPEALEALAPVLDAANVDLKSFRDRFYRDQCGARLEPVLETLRTLKRLGVWVEVTTLIIPGLNDDPEELKELAAFVASLGPETPWHVTRFHPTYKLTDRRSTPVQTLQAARRTGREAGLHYVYTGNIPGDEGENTLCPGCGVTVLRRFGFAMHNVGLRRGHCTACGRKIEGVGLP
ncbi:pyruvate formate lyase activating enzyme [Desulfacinum hydrothermale DSM 13146]|uniref:Pyruvate formate lyase activating enzyme n=1 Tax=Desulfacinum hydrothermale DSM 13146 TaxID=1121390 RepID=A0A1W1WZC6_9BACT|nr:AmmeMemoRadiSam system radical SAM enzyme [Desulfacinum hydrothermale]SMC16953.1 pyruvate formate lyase activating enzyme [Desulfacinum hydrothermale DSM 13146]